MRLICFWCFILAGMVSGQEFYAPQTFRHQISQPSLFQPMGLPWKAKAPLPERNYIQSASYKQGLFAPSPGHDVTPQGSIDAPWTQPQAEQWREPVQPVPLPKLEPWRSYPSKEQKANILHHKQALSSEGSFSFEYASDNGLAAGEVIEPDGSRVGAYQYKDPSGQLVKLKYRAGKDGFQILEGSHLPKSPEPVPPPAQDNYYKSAYEQQRQQYDLQQHYNLHRPSPQQENWRDEGRQSQGSGAGGQYFVQNWTPQNNQQQDDGQILEGSHLPKSPEPVPPPAQDNYYKSAYEQQRQQYDLQQHYNLQRPSPQQGNWRDEGRQSQGSGAGGQYFVQNWTPQNNQQQDDGQILEGSHLPKSPEPVPPPAQDNYYKSAYEQQRQQYDLQQHYNLQRPSPQQGNWRDEGRQSQGSGAGGQYFVQNWTPQNNQQQDDGQYHENELEQKQGPHNFGSGYSFSFQG